VRKLKIEKYIQGQLNESFTVPLVMIRLLTAVLPTAAGKSLKLHGLDLNKIMSVAFDRNLTGYQTSLNVEEGGVKKDVRLTLI
jgi:hypothetical protein